MCFLFSSLNPDPNRIQVPTISSFSNKHLILSNSICRKEKRVNLHHSDIIIKLSGSVFFHRFHFTLDLSSHILKSVQLLSDRTHLCFHICSVLACCQGVVNHFLFHHCSIWLGHAIENQRFQSWHQVVSTESGCCLLRQLEVRCIE